MAADPCALDAGRIADLVRHEGTADPGLVRAVGQVLEQVIHTATDLWPRTARPLTATRTSGAGLARRGVPLTAVADAVRRGADVVWAELAGSPAVPDAGRFWRCVVEHEDALAAGHRSVAAGPSGIVADGGATLAGRLPLRSPDQPVVAVCVLAAGAPVGAADLETVVGGVGLTSVWDGGGRRARGLVAAAAGDVATLATALARRRPGRVGLSAAGPPADAEQGLTVAQWTARSLPAGEPAVARVEDRLAAVLVAAVPQLAPLLVEQSVGGLLALPAAQRRDLMSTVAALVAADGSPSAAGRQLFCHRNTVSYRLRHIQELTGRGMVTPQDKAAWALGLLAARIHPGPREVVSWS